MLAVNDFVNALNDVLWGWPLLVALAATGVFLTVGLRFMPWRKLPEGLKLSVRPSKGAGDISPFQALMTALAAFVGTGNIAGVATAIYFGGPGALFYMWVIALIGMATKYTEAVLAVAYREVDELGNHVGGPMYYIKNGAGAKFPTLALVLALAFAIFTAFAGFGIGNGVQANSVASALQANFGVPVLVSGLVDDGGGGAGADRRHSPDRRSGSMLVPRWSSLYRRCRHGSRDQLRSHSGGARPRLLSRVHADSGGRRLYRRHRDARHPLGFRARHLSNEAGLGSAAIAHAAAKTDDPIQQGLVGMVGVFIDTLIVCTLTGLVIITSGLWTSGVNGAALTSAAFGASLPWGGALVAVSLALFAFTTLLGWSYYGERAVEFLFGVKAIWPYRIVWVLAIPVGAVTSLELVWNMADALNAMMALPNLIALFILAPAVFAMTRNYWAKDK